MVTDVVMNLFYLTTKILKAVHEVMKTSGELIKSKLTLSMYCRPLTAVRHVLEPNYFMTMWLFTKSIGKLQGEDLCNQTSSLQGTH